MHDGELNTGNVQEKMGQKKRNGKMKCDLKKRA